MIWYASLMRCDPAPMSKPIFPRSSTVSDTVKSSSAGCIHCTSDVSETKRSIASRFIGTATVAMSETYTSNRPSHSGRLVWSRVLLNYGRHGLLAGDGVSIRGRVGSADLGETSTVGATETAGNRCGVCCLALLSAAPASRLPKAFVNVNWNRSVSVAVSNAR